MVFSASIHREGTVRKNQCDKSRRGEWVCFTTVCYGYKYYVKKYPLKVSYVCLKYITVGNTLHFVTVPSTSNWYLLKKLTLQVLGIYLPRKLVLKTVLTGSDNSILHDLI